MNDQDFLTALQRHAVQEMLKGENVFLTGFAGTGKTVVIREFVKRCPKKIVCLAPTGLAALNLGKASTIHRFFEFKPGTVHLPEYHPYLCEKLRKTEVFLIDEISMVPSDIFWRMDMELRAVMENNLPFGGKQIIVSGDFYQLPPVVADDEYRKFIVQKYGSEFAFVTTSWDNADFEKIVLREPIRQRDPEFIDILNTVRHGTNNPLKTLQTLNTRVMQRPENTIALCCRCMDAEFINQQEIDALTDVGKSFTGVISGIFNALDLPTKRVLTIKKGEHVMILSNHANLTGYDYVNGDMGTVIDYDDTSVTVLLHDGPVSVRPYIWVNYDYEFDEDAGELICREIGSFRQFPLIPAYATTIHKAQGLTLPRVHIVLGKGCFVEGQLYTALSRVRDLNRITLEVPVKAEDIRLNTLVSAFNQDDLPEKD